MRFVPDPNTCDVERVIQYAANVADSRSVGKLRGEDIHIYLPENMAENLYDYDGWLLNWLVKNGKRVGVFIHWLRGNKK